MNKILGPWIRCKSYFKEHIIRNFITNENDVSAAAGIIIKDDYMIWGLCPDINEELINEISYASLKDTKKMADDLLIQYGFKLLDERFMNML